MSKGSKDGAVVRALASHQCGPGSNPGVDALCGLSLLLVLSLAPRGFSPGTPVIPSRTFGHVSTSSYELLSTPWVNKQITITITMVTKVERFSQNKNMSYFNIPTDV